MGFLSSLLGILGFGFGLSFGIFLGFFLFIYFEPRDVKDPVIRPLHELDSKALHALLPEIPLWVKNPDYDRAICNMIRSTAKPIFDQYIGKFHIASIEFDSLTLGSLPPTIHGMKVYETNEKEIAIEPALRWVGNPNITVMLKVLSLHLTVQLVDLQIFAMPRVTLKPLVPTFPCFANISVSFMRKPRIDFGLKLLGGDIMAIPGLYQFVQKFIKEQVASLYLWPKVLEIPILDSSSGAMKKPVGILHVNVLRALHLSKMDIFGKSDPYVKLKLIGERLPVKKTTIKMKNLNPEWNEQFKLIVKDPENQALELQVYDWEKVGAHDKLGMQVIPLRLLTPNETKAFTLDLLKNMNPNDPQNKTNRGKIMVELTYDPFKEDDRFSGPLDGAGKDSGIRRSPESSSIASRGGLLLVVAQGAEDVEGNRHNNPCAVILFRGEQRKTKVIKKSRDPVWNEEFQFMLEEPPANDKIHIEVISKKTGFTFHPKESLGHVDINLMDVVNNGRINEKYHLINSKNGVIHIEIRWKTI
ncbi:synaptotagmin-3 isoform X2 [Magnolia sinica]|uniref:synaptotagmin-3 isoform X2 n=1 Tax=Magnolia sinica TaxID=86752 RepID=UPI0026599269|nr:synaptotagmin-3 isoform X2 [Magnolia sinica]